MLNLIITHAVLIWRHKVEVLLAFDELADHGVRAEWGLAEIALVEVHPRVLKRTSR